MKNLNKRFKVYSEELIDFAQASGDWNPIHYDIEISRRYFTERPISHGILTLLKVLNDYLFINNVNIISIKCNFKFPVYPDIEHKLYFEKLSNNSDNIYLFYENNLILNCNLKFNYDVKKISNKSNFNKPPKEIPLSEKFENLENNKGKLALEIDVDFFRKNYQYLFNYFSIESLASLISTSRLVGMVCPGLNSIYSSLDIFFNEDFSKNYLYWKVDAASKKILPVKISFNSSGLSGSLNVFYREQPIEQASIKDLSKKFKKLNLYPKDILVIGGSRGIGELTAKLLSLRNANITITYNKGRKDAFRISNEIKKFGFKASCSYLDVLNFELIDKFIKTNYNFDQIYFYASPRIKSSNNKIFDYELYENYNAYYIKPLIKLCEIINKIKKNKIKIFFPSTIFLDEENNNSFKEYQASKLLGELIAKKIDEELNNISIFSHRLPRLLTDQTSKTNDNLLADSTKIIDHILDQMYL